MYIEYTCCEGSFPPDLSPTKWGNGETSSASEVLPVAQARQESHDVGLLLALVGIIQHPKDC